MKLATLAAALVAATPLLAQEAPPGALDDTPLRQLGAEASGDPLALPGEAAAPRAEGTPEERASRLRESFGNAVEGGELANVSCEGPRCTVEVELPVEQPEQVSDRLLAVEDWIAASSPCPYAIATDFTDPPRVRAAINCGG